MDFKNHATKHWRYYTIGLEINIAVQVQQDIRLKGNADRPDEMAIVYHRETDKISDKIKTNKKFSSSPLTTARADDITNTGLIPNPYDNNPKDFDFNNPTQLNKNTDEESIIKIVKI